MKNVYIAQLSNLVQEIILFRTIRFCYENKLTLEETISCIDNARNGKIIDIVDCINVFDLLDKKTFQEKLDDNEICRLFDKEIGGC